LGTVNVNVNITEAAYEKLRELKRLLRLRNNDSTVEWAIDTAYEKFKGEHLE